MASFSVDQIIGKTLTAKKPTPVYNLPSYFDNAKKIMTIQPGKTIGVVYSYVGGSPGKPLNWMYKMKVGFDEVTYYTQHEESNVDKNALQDQGVKTTQEIQKEKEEANKSTADKLIDVLKKYLLIGGLGYGVYLFFIKGKK